MDTALGEGSIFRCSLEVTVLLLMRVAGFNLGNELMVIAVGDSSILRRSLEVIVMVLVRITGFNPGNELMVTAVRRWQHPPIPP